MTGTDYVGGLVGDGSNATITSSYAVVDAVNGTGDVGGLVGDGNSFITIRYSYWDETTSDIATGLYGSPQTSSDLQAPTHYTGIYQHWQNQDCGWDFGTSAQYPTISCLAIGPREQRSFYGVAGGDVRVHIPSFPSE